MPKKRHRGAPESVLKITKVRDVDERQSIALTLIYGTVTAFDVAAQSIFATAVPVNVTLPSISDNPVIGHDRGLN